MATPRIGLSISTYSFLYAPKYWNSVLSLNIPGKNVCTAGHNSNILSQYFILVFFLTIPFHVPFFLPDTSQGGEIYQVLSTWSVLRGPVLCGGTATLHHKLCGSATSLPQSLQNARGDMKRSFTFNIHTVVTRVARFSNWTMYFKSFLYPNCQFIFWHQQTDDKVWFFFLCSFSFFIWRNFDHVQ